MSLPRATGVPSERTKTTPVPKHEGEEVALGYRPEIASSCVIGLPDDEYGNRVHAIVHAATPFAPEEIDTFLRERLVRYKLPRPYEFVTGPPRGDDGKVRRSALRAARLATVR